MFCPSCRVKIVSNFQAGNKHNKENFGKKIFILHSTLKIPLAVHINTKWVLRRKMKLRKAEKGQESRFSVVWLGCFPSSRLGLFHMSNINDHICLFLIFNETSSPVTVKLLSVQNKRCPGVSERIKSWQNLYSHWQRSPLAPLFSRQPWDH